ncbi:4-hydroxythreonine-4-phosphate dehydrogenase PdxA [Gallibacterium anatis]|uniref:4-hydroxythreonine-4-phosphate dehydrogenase n=1 Tax=Gallibacterium anatis TaxID=750 RepID=A0A1A7P4D6_9PAST|nr:4-hydroxythreonine-4-phosphate dehydrogenase PdxA [Gallibacterium anatis]KGQ58547.1 4-hydroxythreonine-4-phosphate dehydrogenase [Gallibacterium anatis DSM 16844 = F 149]OBW97317.1 4-hydroxythreonine-4-phosphate dehydrogenase [Gallibacterium anatis]OBW99057.1 4-hydroxythreonine-4-phosphate dehydrogenase [Gallibacterium anatis]STO38510.1 4-hydroxythreonine-4-phosphate dehydrogenase 2 [Gallibacterium anatis]
MKPVLGITMGDAAGIGAEIIVKSLADKHLYEIAQPIVIGDKKMMQRALDLLQSPLKINVVTNLDNLNAKYGTIDLVDLDNVPADLPYSQVDPRAGKAAYEYVEKAVQYAMANKIQAVVTAPLNKEALHAGGKMFPGHTEILAQLSGTKDYSMMLVSEKLRVIHVTTHVQLRKACDLVKKERVLTVIKLADENAKMLGFKQPRVAVAGLNPHSGENGMFGDEDSKEIVPAVEAAKQLGINASGPIPPDTVFHRAANLNEFDIVVVMYHDQGHIPIKLLGFDTGVNVTVGLPFIRTSVDHGTAFPIAGKGIADSKSMTESLYLAAQMAQIKFGN